MTCPTCMGNGKIAGVHCYECRSSGYLNRIGANPPIVSVVGSRDRIERIKRDGNTRNALTTIGQTLSSVSDPVARRALVIWIVESWLNEGQQPEAACVAREFWTDLPDDLLLRAGCKEEIAERRRLRHMDAMDCEDADADSMDEIDLMSHYAEAR